FFISPVVGKVLGRRAHHFVPLSQIDGGKQPLLSALSIRSSYKHYRYANAVTQLDSVSAHKCQWTVCFIKIMVVESCGPQGTKMARLCGCGLLGVGIWLSVSQGSFATFSPSFPSLSAANMVIAIGAIVMVTGFLGCLGAIKENKCLLLSFFIVLLIILLAELILLILFFVYSDKVSENAKQDLKDGLALYNTDNNIGLRNAWNIIQAEWKCCGVTGYTDWHEALKEKVVPDRCCQEHYQECGRNSTNMFWTRGCYEKVEEWLEDNKHLLGTIGMCILVVQLLGMAFSMTLFHQIHRSGKKYDA
ncbi:hypothetical protein QQF64_012583, partial [Cirrhinus molitorella]